MIKFWTKLNLCVVRYDATTVGRRAFVTWNHNLVLWRSFEYLQLTRYRDRDTECVHMTNEKSQSCNEKWFMWWRCTYLGKGFLTVEILPIFGFLVAVRRVCRADVELPKKREGEKG